MRICLVVCFSVARNLLFIVYTSTHAVLMHSIEVRDTDTDTCASVDVYTCACRRMRVLYTCVCKKTLLRQ